MSARELSDNVRRQVGEWRDWVSHTRDSRPSQAYTILTMCRALYAWDSGTEVSKRVAAEWAMQQLPAHAGIITNALDGAVTTVQPILTMPRCIVFGRNGARRRRKNRHCLGMSMTQPASALHRNIAINDGGMHTTQSHSMRWLKLPVSPRLFRASAALWAATLLPMWSGALCLICSNGHSMAIRRHGMPIPVP